MAVHRRQLSEGAAETALLAGRNVMLAFRQDETPEAACDWLVWHRARCGADAAVICLGPGADAEDFAEALAPVAREMEIVLVAGGTAAPCEVIRHRFLAEARAVLVLTIADLVMPDRLGPVFDRAVAAGGAVMPLVGAEIYPWRLRQGKPALHVDHVAVSKRETNHLSSWAVAPSGCPEDAVWRPEGIAGMAMAETRAGEFRRAMGVARPGVTIGKLVRKADLVERTVLASVLAHVFPDKPRPRPARVRQTAGPEPREVTVVTAMKNEGPFILDWIAHHRAVGVERFLVYTNDCDDGTEHLLDLLAGAGVTRRDNPFRETGQVPQHAAFRAAEDEAVVRGTDWLLTLDVDEYINVHVGEGRLGDLFAHVPEAGAISMPWRLFGNGDRHRFEDIPVVQQFSLAARDYAPRPLQAWAFKTLYRNDGTFGKLGVHRPKSLEASRAGALRWVDGSGRALPARMWRSGWRMTCETWGYDLVSVNHYAVRSAESFLVKRDRGRVNHVASEQGTAYWFRMNHNVVEDRSIRRLDDRVAGERARLAALPGVAAAHERSVGWHRNRIAELKRDPGMAELYRELTGPRLERLSRMTSNFGASVFYAGPEVIPDKIAALGTEQKFYFTV
ncbi:MAG: glycosyltransferase family 2 protein [Silicimonas sp.]|nr:glycosyltransferase family 2 protein [Silicimonas sp.]